ncbi:hypothetical protein QW71_27570 [Paenibacillus sp. IHB B 3415]|nr:hypothetical protein QW71_27570 [Paenibacillus sp. IHB B 3415]
MNGRAVPSEVYIIYSPKSPAGNPAGLAFSRLDEKSLLTVSAVLPGHRAIQPDSGALVVSVFPTGFSRYAA